MKDFTFRVDTLDGALKVDFLLAVHYVKMGSRKFDDCAVSSHKAGFVCLGMRILTRSGPLWRVEGDFFILADEAP